MRDGADESDDGDMGDQPADVHGFGQDGGRGGAMVEEAKKLMADMHDDEVAPQQEDTGPKIKMGRIKKGKKPRDAAPSYTKQITNVAADMPKPSVSGGFNENDIEFMKKAIQILCQSTNPLGKSIDFVTDDVDSMSKEYEHWRRESISCT